MSLGNGVAALSVLLDDLCAAALQLDAMGPVGRSKDRTYQPGIGPLREADFVDQLLPIMRHNRPKVYDEARPVPYPASKAKLDLLVPASLAVEFKLIRPFGDNGREAEHWSENAVHPYPGNVSAVGDCLKLRGVDFGVARAVVIYGFEHAEPVVRLEPAVRMFEFAARSLYSIDLSDRQERVVAPLMHPVHQVMRVFGWVVDNGLQVG